VVWDCECTTRRFQVVPNLPVRALVSLSSGIVTCTLNPYPERRIGTQMCCIVSARRIVIGL
jgi:hypothetical protein